MTTQLLEYLSHSRLSCYRTCSLQFRYRYIDKLTPAFIPGALAFGVAFHAAVEEALVGLMAGAFPPVDDLVKVFTTSLDAQVVEIPIRYSEREDRDSMIGQARRMLMAWTGWERPKSTILAVEHQFKVPLAAWLPPLVGRVDLIEVHEEGFVALVDVKTSRGRWDPDDLIQHAGQLALYAAGAGELVRTIGKEVRVGFEVVTKAKSPSIERLYLSTDQTETLARQVKIATLVAEGVERGQFIPSPGWSCSTCAFAEACRSW